MTPALTELSKLSFPLNAYAALQLWAEGTVEYLHFGLFEPGDDVAAAQKRSTDFLLQQLPPPPARLLEVGIGLGGLARRLTEAGYEVVGVTPEATQVELVASHAPNARLLCTRYEDMPDLGTFDVVIFQESAQYVSSLAIFGRAWECLAPGGVLLVVDEFALRRTATCGGTLHHLDHFLALAERAGFRLVQRRDVGPQAAHTLDYLLEQQRRFAAQLQDELGVAADRLQYLEAANRASREHYSDGRFGYELLAFERMPARQALFASVASDAGEGLELPAASVGAGRGSAGEPGLALGAWRNGRLQAACAGIPGRVRCGGRDLGAVRLTSLAARPADKRLALAVLATFLEQHAGYGTPQPLAFARVPRRLASLGERFGFCTEVEAMVGLEWVAAGAYSSPLTTLRQISPDGADFDTVAGRLWARLADDLGDKIMAVRDAAALRERYGRNDGYQLWLVRRRFSATAIGLIAVRPQADHLELADVVAPLGAFACCLAQARRLAARLGLPSVRAEVAAGSAELLDPAANRRDSDYVIVCNTWSAGPGAADQRGRWWATSGDLCLG